MYLTPEATHTVKNLIGSQSISTLETIGLVLAKVACNQRCVSAVDCPKPPSSQDVALNGIIRRVQAHPDRYPALHSIKIVSEDNFDKPISFSTRAGRDRVCLGALAPVVRALGLTLRDQAGLPWLEAYNAEWAVVSGAAAPY